MGASPDGTRLNEVARAVRALLRAERTLRTYPADNQLSRNALGDLDAQLVPALPIDLHVRADRFLWQDDVIAEAAADRTDLPQRLHRDGVRQLYLAAGLGSEELERLVVALSRPIHPDDLSEDYVTRIWEAELTHVRVAAIDPYIDPDLPEDVLEGKLRPEEPLSELAGTDGQDEELQVLPPPEDAFHVTAAEADAVRAQVDAAATEPPWERFTQALADVLSHAESSEDAAQVVQLLETTFQRAIDEGRVTLGAEILGALQSHSADFAQRSIDLALERIVTPERLLGLHAAIEAPAGDAEQIRCLWLMLGPPAAAVLCGFLPRSRDKRVQRFYVETLTAVGEPALAPAARELARGTADVQVLCAQVLGSLSDPRACAPLIAALGVPDPAVRREAVRALGRIGADRGLERLLSTALIDPDPSTRIVALRVLGSARARLNAAEILARIRASSFNELADDEQDLLYRALGATGAETEDAVPFLRKAIETSWLRSRGTPRAWKRAAAALAQLGSLEAIEALERGARSRRRELAEICRASLEDVLRGNDGESA